MRKCLSILFVLFLSFGLMIHDAEAKRFGGGRSFGTYRSTSSFSRSQPSAFPAQQPLSSNKSKWLGPLAGLAAGGLLASLFMGHGIGSGIMSWVLIAMGVMLLLKLFQGAFSRRSSEPYAMHHAGARLNEVNQTNQTIHSSPANYTSHQTIFSLAEEEAFLRSVKVQFMRLQAAYDHKNLQDISQFTTPEVFAEIKMQLQERGDSENITDVMKLDAKLVEARNENHMQYATVEFSGVIKEGKDELPSMVNEIWHFQREMNGAEWRVAGVQQN